MNSNANNRLVAAVSTATLLSTAAPATIAEEWEFYLSPLFLWGQSLDGEATLNGKTAPLDLDFQDDILENLDGAFTFHFEARRGDFGIFTEYQYVSLDPGVGAMLGPLEVNADVEFKEHVFEAGGAWAFINEDDSRMELLLGARYTDQDVDVDLSLAGPGPLPPQDRNITGGDDWWHGIVGLRLIQEINRNWTFVVRGDYGYGGSDNTAANLAFQFDWKFNSWGSLFIGGRYMVYDYEDSDYGFDADRAGPLGGLMIRW